jgi:hypothetical protein
MATKAYQADFTARIKGLVDKAGGVSEFARKVWGDAEPHKGKVGRWYHGKNGIDGDEALDVARTFGKRAGWLMFGELPENAGETGAKQKLSDADLYAEITAWAQRNLLAYVEATDLNVTSWHDIEAHNIRVDPKKLLALLREELNRDAECSEARRMVKVLERHIAKEPEKPALREMYRRRGKPAELKEYLKTEDAFRRRKRIELRVNRAVANRPRGAVWVEGLSADYGDEPEPTPATKRRRAVTPGLPKPTTTKRKMR